MLLTKGQILKVEKRKYKTIFIEELGGEIRIASISAGCGLEMSENMDKRGAQALALFTSSIVNENGEALFDEDEARAFVGRISTETMQLIMSEIVALSGNKPKASNGAEVPAQNPSEAAPRESSPTA